eukprot:945271-Rhodomonas_salina.1
MALSLSATSSAYSRGTKCPCISVHSARYRQQSATPHQKPQPDSTKQKAYRHQGQQHLHGTL